VRPFPRIARGDRLEGRGRWGQRGSAAVEFALVLPLLLIITLALVQVGLLVKDQLVVQEAARAAARQAAVSTDDDSARQAAFAAAGSLDPNRLDVAIERQGGAGTPATVTVHYRAPIAVPAVGWLFPSEVDLEGAAVMRQETG
jgi:Flp pilus assembly protein TadG